MGFRLEIKEITKSFSRSGIETVKAIDNVSLYVKDREIISLIGPSGCGKSTLLNIVAGLNKPDNGEVFFDGKEITGKKGFTSYMPQKDVLFPWRTILDNVIVGLEVKGIHKKEARKEAFSLLPVFGLENFAHSYPNALSGGMRQRASFLRTYLCKKELMLLDEPFGKLDALTRLQMQKWLLKMWEKFSHTVLLVTHDVDEAILLSDRIYVMTPRPGRILAEVEVKFPRPRDFSISADPEFSSLKMNLLALLGQTEKTEENTSVNC